MKELFDFKRYMSLLKKILFENRVFLFGYSFIVIFLEVMIYFLNGNIYQQTTQLGIFSLFIILVLSPTVLVDFLMNDYSDKNKRIANIMVPVSRFENWLVIFTICYLIFLPIHIMILKFLDTVFIDYYRDLALQSKDFSLSQIEEKIKYLSFYKDYNVGILFFVMSFYSTSIFLIGSLTFNRLSYFKTAFIFVLLYFSILYATKYITDYLIGSSVTLNFPSFDAIVNLSSDPIYVKNSAFLAFIIKWLLAAVIPIVLWLVALLRFKEKEI
jgi:hypothetical protein